MEKQTLARAGYALRGGSPSVAGTTVSPSGRFSRYGCACAQNDKLYRRVRVILYGLTLFNRTKRTRFLSGALVEKSPAREMKTSARGYPKHSPAVAHRRKILFLFKKFLTNGKRGYIIY